MQSNTQKLAEQIANLFTERETEKGDFAALRRSVEQISERLAEIENILPLNAPHSALRAPQLKHPSQEKFEITEAVADAHNSDAAGAEKPCPFEPTGKACDHCSMCSSRGF